MDHPGVVVVHEANLHHLIADITIKRGDWDAYMRAVEQEGSAEDLAYAERVRRLEVGPDYEGVPMLRQLAEPVQSGHRAQRLRGDRIARRRIFGGGGSHPARRLDSGGQPLGLSRASGSG